MLTMCSFWHTVVADCVRRCAFVLILCSVATCCIDPLREGASWMLMYVYVGFVLGEWEEFFAIIGEVAMLQHSFQRAQFKFNYVGGYGECSFGEAKFYVGPFIEAFEFGDLKSRVRKVLTYNSYVICICYGVGLGF